MPRVAPLRTTKKHDESPTLKANRSSKWPPWHWPWWLVIIALQVPLLGGAFVLGALSTMVSAQREISKLKHTLIMGSPHAIASATQSHGVWMTRIILLAIGVGIGVLVGRRFHRKTLREAAPIDPEVPVATPKSIWGRELLAAALWSGTVIALGYVVLRTGSHLTHLSFKQL